jgi:uncharacterized DUF497 family protein
MRITYDLRKSERNGRERNMPFDMVEWLDWDRAVVLVDHRRDYGELRLRVFGPIDGRLCAVVVTPIEGGLRVISLRKANARECKRYDNQQA